MKTAISDFLNYMLVQRGCSPATVETYRQSLSACADFLCALQPGIEWGRVETLHVRRWVSYMMETHKSPNTVNRSLSALRSLYRYLLREGVVDVDPARCVKSPKRPKRIPTFVKENEMNRLFDHYPFDNDYIGCRDRTILLLLYHTGLRAAELLGLHIADTDLLALSLRVMGKGNKQRIVPFGNELRDALSHYFAVRQSFLTAYSPSETFLFLNDRGQPMSYADLRKMVKTTLGAVTTQKKKTPHVLRHSFATAMLANGAQLEAIRELLGHESVTTTVIYTHATAAELKEQYAAAHPREQCE